jgi:hypothetical protein
MKPFVVAIAGTAILLLCLGNPKQTKKQPSLSLKKGIKALSLVHAVRK